MIPPPSMENYAIWYKIHFLNFEPPRKITCRGMTEVQPLLTPSYATVNIKE